MKRVKIKFTLDVIGPEEEIVELSYPDYYNVDDFCSEAVLDWLYEKTETSYQIIENDEFDEELIMLYNAGRLDEQDRMDFIECKNKLNQIAYMLGRIDSGKPSLSNEEIIKKIYNY